MTGYTTAVMVAGSVLSAATAGYGQIQAGKAADAQGKAQQQQAEYEAGPERECGWTRACQLSA